MKWNLIVLHELQSEPESSLQDQYFQHRMWYYKLCVLRKELENVVMREEDW